MKDLIKSDKVLKVALIAGFAAIILIFLSGLGSDDSSEEEAVQNSYETRLFSILTEMEGVSKDNPPQILIKLDKDNQTVLGAVIVSKSAANPIVKERMLEATATALDVSPARICITI